MPTSVFAHKGKKSKTIEVEASEVEDADMTGDHEFDDELPGLQEGIWDQLNLNPAEVEEHLAAEAPMAMEVEQEEEDLNLLR